jgi:hypothetical protein
MAAVTSAVMFAASTAVSVGGAYLQYKGNKKQSEAAMQGAQAEQNQEALRRQAMELDARRRQREVIRTQQRFRSQALAAANNQGAQFGSGLQGGYGQASGQSGVNATGISQNLEIGRGIFDQSAIISQSRFNSARAGGTLALGQGLSSLGGAMMSVLPEVRSLSGGYNSGTLTMLGAYGPGAAGPNRIAGGRYLG